MSSASSSTAGGPNEASGAASGSASAPDTAHNGSAGAGAGGNSSEGNGGGTTDPPGTSSAATSQHRGGTTGSMAAATVLRRKTNVCLICGIYTNLSLNIFEPRNGPNIVDVIYEKYKFRAERGDNADKHICFSCNNWLINWYSLQNTSSGSSDRPYEPAPSTSRSSSSAAADSSNNRHRGRHQHHQGHKSRTKPTDSTFPLNDKENYRPPMIGGLAEQHDQVSSTTVGLLGEAENNSAGTTDRRQIHPYTKRTTGRATSQHRQRVVLRESNGVQQRSYAGGKRMMDDSVAVVSSSTAGLQPYDAYEMLVKPFERQLIRMLAGQGTSVTKECVRDGGECDKTSYSRASVRWPAGSGEAGSGSNNQPAGNRSDVVRRTACPLGSPANPIIIEDDHGPPASEDTSNEIVVSFDSALSEMIDVVPSLKAIQPWWSNRSTASPDEPDPLSTDPVGPLRQRLSSGALTVSIIHTEDGRPGHSSW